MTKFTVEITDQAQLDAITWARQEYYKSNPAVRKQPEDDDEAFVQLIVEETAKSYAMQQASQPPEAIPTQIPQPPPNTQA